MKRLGLIVNPLAGLGGRVGLKGSDGGEIQQKALALGAQPEAHARARAALEMLDGLRKKLEVLTPPAEMGEGAARLAGFDPVVIGENTPAGQGVASGSTTAEDTRRLAREMQARGVDLLLFAGGDGTACDILAAVGTGIPVLGIPAGVKMHSAVFATHPRSAGELARLYLEKKAVHLQEVEVMDLDEEAYRSGRVSARLFGYLRVPYRRPLVQGQKVPTPAGEAAAAEAIALEVVEGMPAGWLYVLGPGTTTRALAQRMGLPKTLTGVDVVSAGGLVAEDVSEEQLLRLMEERPARLVITPIGGQGFLFGRGNQPISAQVIRKAGRENILVVSTPGKLTGLHGRPLLADTGDLGLDEILAGYIQVITGYREKSIYRLAASHAA